MNLNKSGSDSILQKTIFNTASPLPGEKIFLHLDRPGYMQGDTIWFKAYAWFGFDQLPDTVSKVMHVELMNQRDSILMKRKLFVQSGTAFGEFIIDKNMEPGKYLIRVYTHWMQNEDTGEPFYQAVNTGKRYENVYDLLMREFGAREHRLPGVKTIFLPSVSIGPDWYYPIYLLNGKQYFTAGEDESYDMKKRQSDTDSGYANTSQEIGQNPNEQRSSRFVTLLKNLSQIKVSEVKKIMVVPPCNITYHYADPNVLHPDSGSPIMQSLVVLETYSKPNFYRGDPDGIKTFILEGLDSPRSFYSPKYEGSNKENPEFDSRATLLWKPLIRTNENGDSQVEFYTSDRKNSLRIKVIGIGIFNGSTGEYTE